MYCTVLTMSNNIREYWDMVWKSSEATMCIPLTKTVLRPVRNYDSTLFGEFRGGTYVTSNGSMFIDTTGCKDQLIIVRNLCKGGCLSHVEYTAWEIRQLRISHVLSYVVGLRWKGNDTLTYIPDFKSSTADTTKLQQLPKLYPRPASQCTNRKTKHHTSNQFRNITTIHVYWPRATGC